MLARTRAGPKIRPGRGRYRRQPGALRACVQARDDRHIFVNRPRWIVAFTRAFIAGRHVDASREHGLSQSIPVPHRPAGASAGRFGTGIDERIIIELGSE